MSLTNSSDETAEELSARAIKTNRGEWTSFDDLFYHGCCDCGLSHAVRVRRLDDGGHENQWTFHAELTAQTRKSGRHPLWDEVQRLRAELSEMKQRHATEMYLKNEHLDQLEHELRTAPEPGKS